MTEALIAGTALGKYVLERCLGRGGFCESWLARHATLPGLLVSIKVALDPSYRELLRTEGVILAQLRHPGIVRLIDADVDGPLPYVVQEYIAGPTLRTFLTEGGRVFVGLALDLVGQLLEALSEAHSQGIVHRDIKPENLIVDDGGRLHVLDFGLGQLEERSVRSLLVANSMKTSLGTSIAGTVSYMSPEQQRGEPADARADLYAVGVVLFELVTGRLPGLNDAPGRYLNERDGAYRDQVNALYAGLVAPLDCRLSDAAGALAALRDESPRQVLPAAPVVDVLDLRHQLEEQKSQLDRLLNAQDRMLRAQAREDRERERKTRTLAAAEALETRSNGYGCGGCLGLFVAFMIIAGPSRSSTIGGGLASAIGLGGAISLVYGLVLGSLAKSKAKSLEPPPKGGCASVVVLVLLVGAAWTAWSR